MRASTWTNSCRIGRPTELLLDGVFRCIYIVGYATESQQKEQHFDRFFTDRKAGAHPFRVEYKHEGKCGSTGNIAIEDADEFIPSGRVAPGWLHTSIAHYLISYVPEHNKAYWFSFDVLRNRLPEIIANSRRLPSPNWDDFGVVYKKTWNYCVPLTWLHKNGLIVRETSTRNAQPMLF